MAGGNVLEMGLQMHPDARTDILDVRPDVAVVVRCRCEGAQTFLVTLHKPGRCNACGTAYMVRRFAITPTADGESCDVAVGIGPVNPSPIFAPDGSRN